MTRSTPLELGYTPLDRLLIVNADDFGMCTEANHATKLAFTWGGISSASLMVPPHGFRQAAECARAHGSAVGIHLTVTSEWASVNKWAPVAGAAVPSLMDRSGNMWRTCREVFKYSAPAEIETELRAQIELALKAGIDISHLDSHMFILHGSSWRYGEIYLRLARDYQLPVRAARGLLVPIALRPGRGDLLQILRLVRRALLLRAGFSRIVRRAAAIGILHPDYLVIAGSGPPGDSVRYWKNVLKLLPPGLSEIYCHPACGLGDSLAYMGDLRARESDFEFFCSEAAATEIAEQNLTMIDYGALRELMRRETLSRSNSPATG
jgi:chitin disaccharide deacetylase